jgi:hypothetical protein
MTIILTRNYDRIGDSQSILSRTVLIVTIMSRWWYSGIEPNSRVPWPSQQVLPLFGCSCTPSITAW